MDRPALDYTINHLFVPPKLPQEDDSTELALQRALLQHISECAQSFCEGLENHNVDNEVQTRWKLVQRTLSRFADIHNTPMIPRENLEQIIIAMQLHDVCCFHVHSQNAGVILRRRDSEILVEFFQASPSAPLVTGTKGKLVVQYPFRPWLSIPLDAACIKSFSALLADLDCTAMPDSIPKTVKAGGAQEEYRDVRDIRYVSELLGGIARVLTPFERAEQIASSTVYVTKRINDHVLWKSALLPWRRSPKWLIVRVALQTTFAAWNLPEEYGYKVFITFILAKTLELAKDMGVSDDILYVMNAKIATRMWKLRSFFTSTPLATSPFPVVVISQVISSVELQLRRHWESVQAIEAKESTWAVPTSAQVDAAKRFTLPRSSAHFEIVKARGLVLGSQTAVFDRPSFEQKLEANSRRQSTYTPGVSSPDLWFRVLDIEQRLSSSSFDMGTLSDVGDLLIYYDEMASSFKTKNPEIFSRIFLVVLELWVALDRIATQQFPLLLDYPPELSIESFEPLLLPELSQMQRLHNIEIYLRERHARVKYRHLSVFTFNTDRNSLPSRYFDIDGRLQTLRDTIRVQASNRRSEKIQELQRMNAAHAALREEIGGLTCEYRTWTDRWGCWRSEHARWCSKCAKQRRANDMRIMLFEWPLPEEDASNRLVIFELCVPEAFGIWRDITYALARNHSQIAAEEQDDSPAVVLENYTFLRDHFEAPHSKQRITIASTAKSFLESHYKGVGFPCYESSVIQKHPLRYQLWDKVAGKWLPSAFPVVDIRPSCTPNFPDPYKSLKWAMVSTTHTPNNVIARQSQCPIELSYHEWENFGHLRAGVRLQWRNIMLQLISGAIDLANPGVHLLFQQAVWQAETAYTAGQYREAHFDLSQEDFGTQIVRVLDKRLASIAGNWKEGWTAATLAVIGCRLFSTTPHESVKDQVLAFLTQLRAILFTWMEQVSVLLNKSSGHEPSSVARADLVNRVLQLAASCRQTYAVGSSSMQEIFHDRAALCKFIRCAITLHNNVPPAISSLSSALRYLLERDVLTSVEALDLLRDAVSRSGGGLDDAILGTWQGFCRDSTPWQRVGERWVACATSTSSDRQPRSVHLNLQDGSLLVDGHPQGTLPKEIIGHSFFTLLFPNRSHWDIIPSTMRGMDYQSRDDMDGFEMHFKLNGNDLIIRIRNGSGFVSEFIPPKYLEGDLPRSLIFDMVHVFHENSQSLDIYPAPSGWQPEAHAACRLDLASRLLSNTTEIVLDPTSSVVQQLSLVFQPLEARETNLTVSFHSERLYVKLPRYDLEFSAALSGVHLESKELPGFYVSPVQSVGTLIGLESKLVLKSHNGEMTKLFVPDGQIAISGGDIGHPQVAIFPSPHAKHVKMFSYDIDDIVGRVVGDGSLTSWYRLAYLHAATTSHLVDPLLHRMGIRQAQEMLKSAQAFAFMNLEPEDNKILQHILDLSPTRKYYPEHLTSMETIEWNGSLSVVVQCGRFVPLVNAILAYARKQALFHPSNKETPSNKKTVTAKYHGKLCLWERADVRVSRFVSDVPPDAVDVPVTPTRCFESQESATKEHSVAQVAALVRKWPTNVKLTDGFKLWNHFQQWCTFSSEMVLGDKIDNHRFWLEGAPHDVWFRLLHICRASSNWDRDQCYGLMVALGILAYRGDIDLDLIRTLLAIATNPTLLDAANLIPKDTFNLDSGHTLNLNTVLDITRGNCHDTHPDSSWLERQYGESEEAYAQRRRAAFLAAKEDQCEKLSSLIFSHWPAAGAGLTLPDMASILPNSSIGSYPIVEIADLRTAAEVLFSTRLRNRRLFEWSNSLQCVLNTVRGHSSPENGLIALLPLHKICVAIRPPKYVPISLDSLLRDSERCEACPLSRRVKADLFRSSPPVDVAEQSHPSLRELVLDLEGMPIDGPKTQYLADLSCCVDALDRKGSEPSIQRALLPRALPEQWLYSTGQWPSSGPQSLLHQLSRDFRDALPDDWKVVLCRYAEVLAVRQQRRRIDVLAKLGLTEECVRESGARGSQGWEPTTYPDWLLFQLDADLLIRPVQASIAKDMMSPESGRNAVMQLNMGEGKSSVIVPIISSALADGQQLVRVIVLKPLAAQMFMLLKQRVCGLVNRRLFYLPFSRDISLDSAKIEQIFALFKECAQSGGILLCQPEHILSFQLMGLHAFCESETSEETCLLREAQDWLDGAARDILDESDEILNVRYQLIYTIGTSTPPDGRPWRWQITQAVFSLLEKVARAVPDGLDIGTVTKPCQFPVTRIITPESGQDLLGSIVRKIVAEDGLQEWISFRNYSEAQKAIVSRFLQQVTVSSEDDEALRKISGDRFGHLLLLRGLLAHGILDLSLRGKRWRVEYGLDARRTMLAVPYRAKDCPAPRAEFGHPDMIIVLTCLSYYYGGLTDPQLNTSFKLLLNSDNPEAQYQYWVKGIHNLPPGLANLRGLNLDDFEQKTHKVFPLLRYNKAVIDFYLSECVFPKEAREFEHKLTTNAWDLARTRPRLTTGFSGTNDNKYLLPLSIEQRDQDSQRHTNAQVLQYVLQEENRKVICTHSDDALGLLRRVVKQKPPVMVLLDVGAQVLELQNDQVAWEWLQLDTRPEIEAAVYFDPSTDEIRVVGRDGRVQPFVGSLYKKQLGKTLVYLDEAHTRGTDFKFPEGSRAVVTLGPRLTKDKLVQGCMRMRKLGKGHSVLFFASTEIWSKITAATGAQPDQIDSKHVLLWTIRETCAQIQDNGSLWANQGLNFDARHTALQEYDASDRSYTSAVEALLERESRMLEELYGVASRSEDQGVEPTSQLQRDIQRRCQELKITPSDSALSEEQERELAHEKEDEREVERIADAEPCEHSDRDLELFIRTGNIPQYNSFISLKDCLAHTSYMSLLPQGMIFRGGRLRATRDFRDTIKKPSAGSMDSYLRPVQWIMSTARSPDILILVSPFEANRWLPEVRRSTVVYLHLYSPRTSRNTFWPLDALDSFTVPAERTTPLSRQLLYELNLFAGQLFCADKRSMDEVCGILGLHLQSVGDVEGLQGAVDSTGFVQSERARAALGLSQCTFVSTPLPFFRDLFGSRRKGQGFSLTHMGQILRGNDPRDPAFEKEDEARK